MSLTLAIETSCDDTCAAVLDGERVLSNAIASQGVHDAYGGVVPELAARQHVEAIGPVIADALRTAGASPQDIGPGRRHARTGSRRLAAVRRADRQGVRRPGCAATGPRRPHARPSPERSPGGDATTGRAAPRARRIRRAHAAGRVDGADPRIDAIEILGRTLDDAAGEAIDKGARLLGLGYPGGPALARLAEQGDPAAYDLPTSARVAGLDFSFSGLKTALLYVVRDLDDDELEARRADLAASYQRAVVETLVLRVERALTAHPELDHVAIGGGVAANALLRERLAELGCGLSIPAREYCTDNAAMIGVAAASTPAVAYPQHLGLDAYGTGQGPIR